MLPEVCRPLKKLKKNNVEKEDPKKVEKNNVEQVDPQKVEKKRQKGGVIYSYIPSYPSIYLHILPNSFTYLHIPPHTSKS